MYYCAIAARTESRFFSLAPASVFGGVHVPSGEDVGPVSQRDLAAIPTVDAAHDSPLESSGEFIDVICCYCSLLLAVFRTV